MEGGTERELISLSIQTEARLPPATGSTPLLGLSKDCPFIDTRFERPLPGLIGSTQAPLLSHPSAWAATARLVPSLSFHPTSTVSSARAPQACFILQPIMGFTAFPPSVPPISPGLCAESLRPSTSSPHPAPGLSHSVRFEISISNHPSKVFPPPQPYPVSSLKIEEACKQCFNEDCSWGSNRCFRSGLLPGLHPSSSTRTRTLRA